MGIKDLLRFMKPYIQPIHIEKYAGKRVGIDAYSWLHKGAYSCSMELCLDSDGDRKFRYIEYFMHRVNLLRHYKITPVVVFDGGNVPCKAGTEQERHRKRKANRELAMAKLKEGNVSAASELFQRAVNITPLMAHKLIQTLKSENIEFVVAPYEADAQLAYMSNLEPERGGVAAVITEDSDLIAYGCPAIIFKMDRQGNGERIELEKVFSAESGRPSFRGFDLKLFTGMCVLAGCDFLPSVPGIGVARAHGLVSKYRNLDRILSVLKFEKGDQMPEDYAKSFQAAVAVFQHARIYDTNTQELKHMNPLPQDILESLDGKLDFLGPEIPPTIVTAIAEGNLNPSTKEAFEKSESPRFPLHPIDPQNIGQTYKSEVPTSVTQENCFSVFGSHNTSQKSTVTRLQDENKYSDEALALQKLIIPLDTKKKVKKTILSDDTPLKVPDNNPFRIRKPEEVYLVQKEDTVENVSSVNSVEYIDLCLSPNNFEEEALALQKLITPLGAKGRTVKKTITSDDTPLKVPDNNPFRIRKPEEVYFAQKEDAVENVSSVNSVEYIDLCLSPNNFEEGPKNLSRKRTFHNICSDKLEGTDEEVSGVTEVVDCEVLCLTVETQESVNSETRKSADLKAKGGSEKKSKRSNSKKAGSNSRTILNFFSRV